MHELFSLLENGNIKVIIGEVHPIEEAAKFSNKEILMVVIFVSSSRLRVYGWPPTLFGFLLLVLGEEFSRHWFLVIHRGIPQSSVLGKLPYSVYSIQ